MSRGLITAVGVEDPLAGVEEERGPGRTGLYSYINRIKTSKWGPLELPEWSEDFDETQTSF